MGHNIKIVTCGPLAGDKTHRGFYLIVECFPFHFLLCAVWYKRKYFAWIVALHKARYHQVRLVNFMKQFAIFVNHFRVIVYFILSTVMSTV